MEKFKDFCEVLKRIENTSSRLKQTEILAEYFKKLSPQDIKYSIYFILGKVKLEFEEKNELNIGEKSVIQALSIVTGISSGEIEKLYKEIGDLGNVAEKIISKKKQNFLFFNELTLNKVYSTLVKITEIEGENSTSLKIRYLCDLLSNAEPIEAKYIVRIVLDNLRLGINAPTIIDALSYMLCGSKKLREKIEEKYNIFPNLPEIGKILKENGIEGLEKINISYFIPLRPALAERLSSAEQIFNKLGPCYCDTKYDGWRLQIHKKGEKIKIFSRNLENITYMFPDLIENLKKIKEDYIIEGEALGVDPKTGNILPFQITMHRKRKHNLEKVIKEIPLKLFLFDIMMLENTTEINKPFSERREILENFLKNYNFENICLSEIKFCKRDIEIKEFFEDRIKKGYEGIIAKDPKAPYIAGKRKFAWIKLKKSYSGEIDTIDAVILGYFKGKGQRSKFDFGGFLAGVYDPINDCFKTIAKVGSGFSEEEMIKLKNMLDKIKVDKKPNNVISNIDVDVWVEPKYVVELSYDNITVSNVHTCGKNKKYALRFPRMIKLREDKEAVDATTEEEIEEMYKLENNQKI